MMRGEIRMHGAYHVLLTHWRVTDDADAGLLPIQRNHRAVNDGPASAGKHDTRMADSTEKSQVRDARECRGCYPMGSAFGGVVREVPCPVLTLRRPEREFVLPD
jgi:hypothetical protein